MAPELKLEGVRFRVWKGDALRARGDARQVTIRRDTNHAIASDLRAELPAQGGPVHVTTPTADGELGSQQFNASGGVVVTHGGERAVTDRAHYEPGPAGKGLVTGEDPVTVERGGVVLHGVGFRFEPQAGNLELNGPVTTESAGAQR